MFRNKKFSIAAALLLTFIVVGSAFAMKEEFNYMSAASLNQAVQNGADVAIVDIQVADEFGEHHIKGAMETCAYPVKSQVEKDKLNPSIEKLKNSNQNIVIICPRGKGGAERTFKYFEQQGIPSYRLFILTDGQAGWPYEVIKK